MRRHRRFRVIRVFVACPWLWFRPRDATTARVRLGEAGVSAEVLLRSHTCSPPVTPPNAPWRRRTHGGSDACPGTAALAHQLAVFFWNPGFVFLCRFPALYPSPWLKTFHLG